MTKEQLQDRIKVLEQALLMHQGALQDCQYWLQELAKAPEAEPQKE